MHKWTSFDTRWMLSLFGTAVGAGILFLPIRAGTGGFWPVVVMSILIFPMVWLSHRNLSRFVCCSSDADRDITHAAEEHWGKKIGATITILYFFAIYPFVLAYGVGLTNTFASFFVNQLHLKCLFDQNTKELYPIARIILTFVLISSFMVIMLFSEKIINMVCNALVYPLCAVLFGISLYLIPHWKFSVIQEMPSLGDFLGVIWLTLPVLVFSFNYSPIISTFSKSVRKEYGDSVVFYKANQILRNASFMILVFIMLFTFSCILCLEPTDFTAAREANIPILSYFANKFNNPWISYGAPLVAFLGIGSSFFGHYFGAVEGLNGIARKIIKPKKDEKQNLMIINIFTNAFMFISLIIISYLNPSILGFIEDLGGPIIAAILFIMPIIGLYTIDSMKKYRNIKNDLFILITGSLTILSVIFKFFV